MLSEGFVTLDGEVVGTFTLSPDDKISIALNKVNNTVSDMLEFAAANGMHFSLALGPAYEEYTPKHQNESDD